MTVMKTEIDAFEQWLDYRYFHNCNMFSQIDMRSAFEGGAEIERRHALEQVYSAVRLMEEGNPEPLFSLLSEVEW